MLALALSACAPGFAPLAPDRPPNLLVVVLDDVGVDKIGSYGFNPDAPATPTLDALAASGVRFTQAWAHPMCSSTRAALLTGRHPRRYGLGEAIDLVEESAALPLDEVTLPEVLTAHASSAAGKWHLAGALADDPLGHPLAQGFDWYAGSLGNLDGDGGDPGDYFGWDKNDNGVLAETSTYATTDTANDAMARLAAMPEPWLLYLAFNAGHGPLHAPPGSEASTAPDQFAAMLFAADAELGRVLGSLDPAVRARTTVVVVGDNGTSEIAVDPAFANGRHKSTVYEGGIRVPLVVSGYGVPRPGVSDALVHAVDLLPTLAELAGAALPDVPLDGVSLVPLLHDPSATVRDRNYAEIFVPNGPGPYTSDQRTLRDAEYKLIRRLNSEELFRLAPGAFDEGENLLAADLDAEAEAAWHRLGAEIDAVVAGLYPD